MANVQSTEPDVIPVEKIKEAHAICMRDPKLAKYFEDAPAGAREYIALMFYCTVFSDELSDDLCAKYQQEVETDLTRDDVLYLATHETNPISKTHFRELYVEMTQAEEAPAPAPAPVAPPAGDVYAEAMRAELTAMRAELTAIRAELGTVRTELARLRHELV